MQFDDASDQKGFEPSRSSPTPERTCEQIGDLLDMPPRKVTQGCVLGDLNDPNSLIAQQRPQQLPSLCEGQTVVMGEIGDWQLVVSECIDIQVEHH